MIELSFLWTRVGIMKRRRGERETFVIHMTHTNERAESNAVILCEVAAEDIRKWVEFSKWRAGRYEVDHKYASVEIPCFTVDRDFTFAIKINPQRVNPGEFTRTYAYADGYRVLLLRRMNEKKRWSVIQEQDFTSSLPSFCRL